MHSLRTFIHFGLPVLVIASPLQLTLTISDEDKQPIRPAWEKENNQLIVPLTSKARTGLIDVATEEGLIHALGPRFANAFYESENSSSKDIFGCLTCGKTVIEAVPCIYSAINNDNPASVLNCVPKSDLCGCLSCLPNPIISWVTQEICDAAIVDTVVDKYSPYVDFATLALSSVGVAAFRGDLYTYQVEQLKSINQASPDRIDKNGDVHTMCVIGGTCGDCCCLGGCVFGACLGLCV